MSLKARWAWILLAASLWSCGTSDDSDRAKAPPASQAAVQNTPAVTPAEQVTVTDANGLTIYYYDRDKTNQSTCNDPCAEFWLPVRPSPPFEGAVNFATIERTDGTPQLTFRGRPLYTFRGDKKPGDATGDGQQGVWHVLKY